MKTNLNYRSLIVIILFVAMSTTVMAQRQGGQKKVRPTQNCEMQMKKMLPDLTDDQVAKIEKLHLQMIKEATPIKSVMKEKKARLHTLAIAEKVDMNAINSTIDEISTLQAKLMKIRAKYHQDVRALLTDDQRILFDSRKGHKMHKRGNGQGQNCRQGSTPQRG